MDLPDWSWQLWFGRFGWGVVVGALVLGLLARVIVPRRPLPRALIAGVCLLALVGTAMPGRTGLAYWLLMIFQWPSALLVAWCAGAIAQRWRVARPRGSLAARSPRAPPSPWLPQGLAAAIAVAGAALYLDVSGWVAWGLYPAGFGPVAAPVIALAVATGCLVAFVRQAAPDRALVLLAALFAYSIARLPTGNLWDALIDPLLWTWSLASLAVAAWSRRQRRRRAASADPALHGSTPA